MLHLTDAVVCPRVAEQTGYAREGKDIFTWLRDNEVDYVTQQHLEAINQGKWYWVLMPQGYSDVHMLNKEHVAIEDDWFVEDGAIMVTGSGSDP